MQRLTLLGGLIVFTIVLPLASCGESPGNGTNVRPPESSHVLRRGNGGDPQSLDPAAAEDIHAFNVLTDLYDGLVIEDNDGTILPGVAHSWSVSADELTYRFFLRNDARWSNKESVTADNFVNGFQRTVAQASSYSFLLSPIRNYAAVTAAELPLSELAIRAVGDYELVIELTSPTPHFLGILAMPVSFPLYPTSSSDPQRFVDPQLFVGNGPYVLAENRLMDRIRLRRNPEYYDLASVGIEFIDYYPVEDLHTELNMYRAGELDITATVPPAMLTALQNLRPKELQIAPALALYYLAFDLSEPPMNNLQLRKALSMAIDREELVRFLGRGEQPAFGVVPPGVAGHKAARYSWESMKPTKRQEVALRAYKDAGYGDENPLHITLTYDVGDIHQTVALAVSAMWRNVLGAEIILDKREWKYFLATRERREQWQIMRFSWVGDYNGATTFLDIFRSGNLQNLSGYANDHYDSLVSGAATLRDPRERMRQMTAAEQRLLDDYPIAPLYFFVSKHLVSPRVRGFKANVLDRHPSRYLTLEQHSPPTE